MNASTEATIITPSVQTITPEIAERYLASTERNRYVKPLRVDRYAKDMAEGRWVLSGSPIVFDNKGHLIDGQHRLRAVAKSRTTQQFVVLAGLDRDTQLVMDNGATRTAGDQLSLLNSRLPMIQASAAFLIVRFKGPRPVEGMPPYYMPSTPEVIEFARTHPELEHSAEVANKCRHILTSGIAGAFHFLFAEKDKEQADEFFETLGTGVGLTANDPIYTLRERLIKERGADRKLARMTIMVFTIKAWNAFRKGEPVQRLKWKQGGEDGRGQEPFPKIE